MLCTAGMCSLPDVTSRIYSWVSALS